MSVKVVVLGSGYGGAGAIRTLETALPPRARLTWVSDVDHHLVLHESHRCIRDPRISSHIAIPVEEIRAPETTFRQGRVTAVDVDSREVSLDGGGSIPYDYLLVGIGTTTAMYGIEGLETHAHTLERLDDALGIHEALERVASEATRTEPGRVVVGGAGLTGVQVAGEIAWYRDDRNSPLEIALVEGLDQIVPESHPEFRGAVRSHLESRDIRIETGSFITAVDESTVFVGDSEEAYDLLIWTGGIAGREASRHVDLEKDERSHRVKTDATFRTSNPRVFALGDAALIDQPETGLAPPDAQAAWQAATTAGTNIARAIRGEPLETWLYHDRGRVVSVGADAIAHDVAGVPLFRTFDGLPARLLKKMIAARWIRHVGGTKRAVRAWPVL